MDDNNKTNEDEMPPKEYLEYVKQIKINARKICMKKGCHDLIRKTRGRGYDSHYHAVCKICDYEERENWYTGVHKGYQYESKQNNTN